jgi:mannosyltransferase
MMRDEKLEIRKKKLDLRPLSAKPLFGTPDPHQIIHLTALIIVALGFGLRLYHLASESLWYDELLQLDIAQGTPPGQGGLASIFPRLRGHSAVPLDYLISHGWMLLGQIDSEARMLRQSDGWMRIPAVIWGTLTLPIAYQMGRKLLGGSYGLLFMALLAFSPLHVRYSQEARPYALVVWGVILTGYAFWQIRATGHWRYIFLLQIGVLVFSLSHIFAVTIFGMLLIFAIIDLIFNQNRGRAAASLIWLLVAGLIVLVILLALGWAAPLYHSAKNFGGALLEPEKFTVEAGQKPNRGAGPHVDWIFVKYEVMERLGVGDRSPWLLNSLVGLGFIYLLIQKKYKLTLLLLLWLALPVTMIVAFLVYRGAFYAPRYIVPVLPAYLIFLAVGILAFPNWLKRVKQRGLALGIFLILSGFIFVNLSSGLDRLYQRKNKENWRIIAEFINRNASPTDAVIAMKAEPVINWYYPQAWAPPNYYDKMEHIQASAARAQRTWLILSIFSSGVHAKVKTWLRQSQPGAIRLVLDPAISVYYFDAKATRQQLLQEAWNFPMPVDYALYARLAHENQSNPKIARQYYQLAIAGAPNDQIRAEYQRALETLTTQ